MSPPLVRLRCGAFLDFLGNRRGSSAVEFAIMVLPFTMVLLFIVQMGIYYAAQSSLNAGVIQAADALVNSYNGGASPTTNIKALVYSKSGGMIHNDGSFFVEVVELASLGSGPIAIGNDTTAATTGGAPRDVLALRAQGTITTFVPGFASMATIRATALIRRQGT